VHRQGHRPRRPGLRTTTRLRGPSAGRRGPVQSSWPWTSCRPSCARRLQRVQLHARALSRGARRGRLRPPVRGLGFPPRCPCRDHASREVHARGCQAAGVPRRSMSGLHASTSASGAASRRCWPQPRVGERRRRHRRRRPRRAAPQAVVRASRRRSTPPPATSSTFTTSSGRPRPRVKCTRSSAPTTTRDPRGLFREPADRDRRASRARRRCRRVSRSDRPPDPRSDRGRHTASAITVVGSRKAARSPSSPRPRSPTTASTSSSSPAAGAGSPPPDLVPADACCRCSRPATPRRELPAAVRASSARQPDQRDRAPPRRRSRRLFRPSPGVDRAHRGMGARAMGLRVYGSGIAPLLLPVSVSCPSPSPGHRPLHAPGTAPDSCSVQVSAAGHALWRVSHSGTGTTFTPLLDLGGGLAFCPA
jgi:hypothetical protein